MADVEIVSNVDYHPTLVVVGIPTFGTVSIHWTMSLLKLSLMNFRTRHMVVEGFEVGEARDYIVRQALEYCGDNGERATHVMFIDDDVLVPPDAVMRLLAHDRPIVGGLYYAKVATPSPLILNDSHAGVNRDWTDGDLVECAAHGMGCTLIQREVFEAIEPPWFVTVNERRENTRVHSTEDVHFCRKARAAGYQPTVDTGLFCPHYHAQERRWYPLDRFEAAKAASEVAA